MKIEALQAAVVAQTQYQIANYLKEYPTASHEKEKLIEFVFPDPRAASGFTVKLCSLEEVLKTPDKLNHFVLEILSTIPVSSQERMKPEDITIFVGYQFKQDYTLFQHKHHPLTPPQRRAAPAEPKSTFLTPSAVRPQKTREKSPTERSRHGRPANKDIYSIPVRLAQKKATEEHIYGEPEYYTKPKEHHYENTRATPPQPKQPSDTSSSTTAPKSAHFKYSSTSAFKPINKDAEDKKVADSKANPDTANLKPKT